MKKYLIPLVALGVVLALSASGALARSQASADICVLLPDKTSSVR